MKTLRNGPWRDRKSDLCDNTRRCLDLMGRPPLYRGSLGLRATSGRLAQRESTPFTRVGSQVQSLHRPPSLLNITSAATARLFPLARGLSAQALNAGTPTCGTNLRDSEFPCVET